MLSFAEIIDELVAKRKGLPETLKWVYAFAQDVSAIIFTLYCLATVGFQVEEIHELDDQFNNYIEVGGVCYTSDELAFKGLIYYLGRNNINWEDKHIVYVGKKYTLGGATETVTKPGARNFSEILRLADLIITNHKINCYPMHCPVVDLNGLCINTDNRDVAVQRYNELVAIGALLTSENL